MLREYLEKCRLGEWWHAAQEAARRAVTSEEIEEEEMRRHFALMQQQGYAEGEVLAVEDGHSGAAAIAEAMEVAEGAGIATMGADAQSQDIQMGEA